MAQPIGKLKNISTYFSAFPEAFEPFIPQNEVLFFNLGKLSKEDLMGFQHGMIQSARLIQQNFGNPEELGKHVRKIVESLAPYFDKAGIRSIFHYLVSFVEIEREELIQIADEVSNQNHPNMKTVYDQLIELGVEKGIEKGDFKDMNVKLVSFTIFSALNATYDLYKTNERLSQDEIAESISNLLLKGIKK